MRHAIALLLICLQISLHAAKVEPFAIQPGRYVGADALVDVVPTVIPGVVRVSVRSVKPRSSASVLRGVAAMPYSGVGEIFQFLGGQRWGEFYFSTTHAIPFTSPYDLTAIDDGNPLTRLTRTRPALPKDLVKAYAGQDFTIAPPIAFGGVEIHTDSPRDNLLAAIAAYSWREPTRWYTRNRHDRITAFADGAVRGTRNGLATISFGDGGRWTKELERTTLSVEPVTRELRAVTHLKAESRARRFHLLKVYYAEFECEGLLTESKFREPATGFGLDL